MPVTASGWQTAISLWRMLRWLETPLPGTSTLIQQVQVRTFPRLVLIVVLGWLCPCAGASRG